MGDNVTESRVFHYKIPIWGWIYLGLMGVVMIFVAIMSLDIVYTLHRFDLISHSTMQRSSMSGQFVLMGLVSACVAASILYSMVRQWHLVKFGAIRLDGIGLSLTNYQADTRLISWADLQEIRIGMSTDELSMSPDVTLIIDNSRKLELSTHIADRQELINDLISSAGFEKTSEKWYGTVYSRVSE